MGGEAGQGAHSISMGLPSWGLAGEGSVSPEAPPRPKRRGLWGAPGHPRGGALHCLLQGTGRSSSFALGCAPSLQTPSHLALDVPARSQPGSPAQPPSLPAVNPRIFLEL